jgi:hypothetical protein
MRQYWAHVSAGETAALASFFAEDAYFEDVALGHSYNGRDHIAGTSFPRRPGSLSAIAASRLVFLGMASSSASPTTGISQLFSRR